MSDLADEVLNDPLGRGYDNMSPQEVARDLQDNYRTGLAPITSRSLLRICADEGIITPLEEEADTNNNGVQDVAKAALLMIRRNDINLDLTDAEEEGMVDALVESGVIASSVKTRLEEEAKVQVTRLQELRRKGQDVPNSVRAQDIIDIRQ